jgi:hypothetical protein
LELTYYFLAGPADYEVFTAFAQDSSSNQVAWWVTVGGEFGSAVATYSDSEGWTKVMDVTVDTWYGVRIAADPSTHSYDLSVWEDANPANTTTVTGIDFRNGATAGIIDQFQFGNFNPSWIGYASYAFIDDVLFVGPQIFQDGFDSGDTGSWSSVRP